MTTIEGFRLVHDCPKHGEEDCDGSRYWHWCRNKNDDAGTFNGDHRMIVIKGKHE